MRSARNYGIEEIEKFQAKLKAGRIIPAIATTTAMATGFVCLELYKQVLGLELGARRNLFANLALPGPLLMLSEPMACTKIKSGQRWDPEMYMDVDEAGIAPSWGTCTCTYTYTYTHARSHA